MEVSKGKRFLAYFIDAIIIGVLVYVIAVFALGMDFMTAGFILSIINFALFLFRDLVFNGQSLGKKVLGYKVANLDGTQPSTVSLILRNISLFSFLALVDCILVLIGKDRIGDMISKTKLVNA